MEIYMLLITFFIIISSSGVTYYSIVKAKNKVSCHTVMLATMTLSTANGLIIGTVLGLSQSFSMNCILSMTVGISTGMILGILFNMLTTIEGIVSGVMGGLMGAMLGAMLETSAIYFVASMLLFIIIFLTILLVKQIQQEVKGISIEVAIPIEKHPLNKLTIVFLAFSIILCSTVIISTSLSTNTIEEQPSSSIHHHE